MELKEIEEKIKTTEAELNKLNALRNYYKEQEKQEILSSNSAGFKKVLYLLKDEFISSPHRTKQYLEFHKVFKKEFTKLLKPYCSEIRINKPNHFDITGFFKLNSGTTFYFSISDLRWNKNNLLIRTAKNFEDYTGGSNKIIALNSDFNKNLIEFLKPYL